LTEALFLGLLVEQWLVRSNKNDLKNCIAPATNKLVRSNKNAPTTNKLLRSNKNALLRQQISCCSHVDSFGALIACCHFSSFLPFVDDKAVIEGFC
jgi:hypothetical protein